MLHPTCIITFFAIINAAQGGILIWGSQNIQIPSLKHFNNEDFDLLKAYMRNPKVLIFQGNPMEISEELQGLLKNKYTAYIPNSNLIVDDVIELDEGPLTNFNTIQRKIEEEDGNNILAMIISTNNRLKRDVEETTEAETEEPEYEPPSGPVLYSAEGKAMIYSSKPPLLKMNSSTISLGKATLGTIDNRGDKYTRLSVTIPVDIGGKVTLRFKFPWNRGYWALTSVELLDTDSKTFTLTLSADVAASRNFSYHCSGQTVFTDQENEIELKLFDIQVQPDTQNGRFDDAFDCVNFTTAPIWSGLFITFILIIVLGIGLGALNSIKTMDKFDNYKTKQLTITTSE